MNLLNTSGGSTGSSYTVGAVKRDDDEHHAVTVLCSSDELYTLGQDMCVSCGSFGLDEEGRLISCTQCGQSYHSYCAGLNKVNSFFFYLIKNKNNDLILVIKSNIKTRMALFRLYCM